MDALENAIRGAFQRGNPEDRAYREKVYRSAFAALNRALAANPELPAEEVVRRKDGLKALIRDIETEFVPARTTPRSEAPTPQVEPEAATPRDQQPGVEPPAAPVEPEAPAQGPRAPEPRAERTAPGPQAAPVAPEPRAERGAAPRGQDTEFAVGADRADSLAGSEEAAPAEEKTRPRRRPWATMFVIVTLLAALAIGGWWALETGLFTTPRERHPAPPPQEEAFTPDEEGGSASGPGQAQQTEWVTVFAPDDPTQVTAPSDAGAEIIDGDGETFLRIRSGASGSAIAFDVAQGILEEIAGRHAVFDIVARAQEGQPTQISVSCNFGELGDCGRKRYEVGNGVGDYLFEVDLPDLRPGAGGTIAINTDIEGAGKAIDVFEIKVSLKP